MSAASTILARARVLAVGLLFFSAVHAAQTTPSLAPTATETPVQLRVPPPPEEEEPPGDTEPADTAPSAQGVQAALVAIRMLLLDDDGADSPGTPGTPGTPGAPATPPGGFDPAPVNGVNGTITYIHTDALGSPVVRTDTSGNIVSRTRYEPYGLTASGALPTMGFTGHMNDADTGLVYMQQRYYDPVAGRFLSIDPVTTDANTGSSFNRYVYAINNPFKYIDPDGRQEHAAEAFGDQFRIDIANGNGDVYKPLQKPAMIITGAMLVAPVAIVAVDAAAVGIAGKIAQKHWKGVSLEQKAEIRDFLKGSEKTADKVATDTLKKYEKIAERQINRGKDNNGEQQRRAEVIKEELKRRDE